MYEAFDAFLRIPTWYTRHPNDEERFFLALATLVRDPQFDPDSFGQHIDQKRERGEQAQARLREEDYFIARDHYVHAARAVQRYLRVTSQL
jgi:hypothetical protein